MAIYGKRHVLLVRRAAAGGTNLAATAGFESELETHMWLSFEQPMTLPCEWHAASSDRTRQCARVFPFIFLDRAVDVIDIVELTPAVEPAR